jgi:hypothetical protein
MEKKLDKIAEDISEIKTTLAEQHITLKEHIRRTELLESDLHPIKVHVAKVEGAFKLIMALIAIAAAIGAFHK